MPAQDRHQQWIDDAKVLAQAERDARATSKIGASYKPLDAGGVAAWEIGAGVNKRVSHQMPPTVGRVVGKIIPNKSSRFEQRFTTRDDGTQNARRRAIRKRSFGSWSDMPCHLRFHYTEGERAALHIVSAMVLRHGFCDLSIKEIADLAGVSRTTVKNAFTEARALGHIAVRYRKKTKSNNLPNVVTIISAEWLNWLESLAVKKKSTLKNSRDKQQKPTPEAPSKWAFERERADLFGIHNHPLRRQVDPMAGGQSPWGS